MKKPLEYKTVKTLEYEEIERLALEVMGINHEIIPSNTLSNGSYLTLWAKKELRPGYEEDEFKADLEYFNTYQSTESDDTRFIVQYLCFEGYIEPGTYITLISW